MPQSTSNLVFNKGNLTQSIYKKHMSIILDLKLTSENNIKIVTTKIIRLLDFPKNYKSFVPETAMYNQN